jgi:hypothetical protein
MHPSFWKMWPDIVANLKLRVMSQCITELNRQGPDFESLASIHLKLESAEPCSRHCSANVNMV